MKYTKARAAVVMFDNSDIVTTSFNTDEVWGECGNPSIENTSTCEWASIGSTCGQGSYKNP